MKCSLYFLDIRPNGFEIDNIVTILRLKTAKNYKENFQCKPGEIARQS